MLLFIYLCVVDFSSLLGDKKIASVDYVDKGYRKKDDLDYEEDRLALEGKVVDIVRDNGSFVLAEGFDDKVSAAVGSALDKDGGLKNTLESAIKEKVDSMDNLATKEDIYEDDKYTVSKYVLKADYEEEKEGYYSKQEYALLDSKNKAEASDMSFYSSLATINKIKEKIKERMDEGVVVVGEDNKVDDPEGVVFKGYFINASNSKVEFVDIAYTGDGDVFVDEEKEHVLKYEDGSLKVCEKEGGACLQTVIEEAKRPEKRYATEKYVIDKDEELFDVIYNAIVQ